VAVSLRANNDGSAIIYVNGSPRITMDAAGNILAALTPPRGDSSLKAATTEYVRQSGGNYSGTLNLFSDATLDAGASGRLVLAQTGVTTVQLPLVSSVFTGAVFTVKNQAATGISVTPLTPDTISVYAGANLSTTTLAVGEIASFTASGDAWIMGDQAITARLPNFAKFLTGDATSVGAIGDSGWGKLPNGMMWQWVRKNFTRTAGNFKYADISWPVPFPTRCVSVNPAYAGESVQSGSSTPLFVDNMYSKTGVSIGTSTATWSVARGDMVQQYVVAFAVGY
jgi:hypothetical protein